MDIRQAIKEKERIASEIEKMLERFSEETGLLISVVSISYTCSQGYDIITRNCTPVYSYTAEMEVKF